MTTASKLALALVALAAVATTSLQAQASGQITATATVQTPITITPLANLDFGNVFPGLAKTVLSTGAGAGQFQIAGQGTSEVNITFTLPTNLVFNANNLPIGTWTGGQFGTNTQASQTSITPTGSTTTNLVGGGLFVWLGATVTPAVAQVAGTYTALVTMSVAYTGN